jgi:hypothetical protein
VSFGTISHRSLLSWQSGCRAWTVALVDHARGPGRKQVRCQHNLLCRFMLAWRRHNPHMRLPKPCVITTNLKGTSLLHQIKHHLPRQDIALSGDSVVCSALQVTIVLDPCATTQIKSRASTGLSPYCQLPWYQTSVVSRGWSVLALAAMLGFSRTESSLRSRQRTESRSSSARVEQVAELQAETPAHVAALRIKPHRSQGTALRGCMPRRWFRLVISWLLQNLPFGPLLTLPTSL